MNRDEAQEFIKEVFTLGQVQEAVAEEAQRRNEMNTVTIPEAAMPVVLILRRDVERPTAEIYGHKPRFECGKCPMGLHPTALGDTPMDMFTEGSPLLVDASARARTAFVKFWDGLSIEQAYEAVNLIWPGEKTS